MSLSRIALHVGLGVAILLGLTSIAIVGRSRFLQLRTRFRPRILTAAPYIALLGVVLVVNRYLRTTAQDLSWIVGIEITSAIYAVEGGLVPWIQSHAWPPLTAFFSATYVYGYVFLLTFPIVAYLALADGRPLRKICLAYSYNYALGLCLYVLFVAYGPRNLLPDLVESLMYTTWPESQVLTSQVNANTNVFPSLHASLSTTVVLIAYRTRQTYPTWFSLSSALAIAIMVSTMYLGIHWGLDVLAGIGLGIASVVSADRWDPIEWLRRRVGSPNDRGLGRTASRIRDE